MENLNEEINEILEYIDKLEDFSIPGYKELPSIPLFMEQIVGYIDEILEPLSPSSDQAITPFMINNYVKAKIIDAPVKKKYNKDQIGHLIAISLLKNVASMKNIAALISIDARNSSQNKNNEGLYTDCKEIEDENIKIKSKEVKEELLRIKEIDDSEDELMYLSSLALKLYLDAAVHKIFADIITDKVYSLSSKSQTVEKESRKEQELKKKKLNEKTNQLQKRR